MSCYDCCSWYCWLLTVLPFLHMVSIMILLFCTKLLLYSTIWILDLITSFARLVSMVKASEFEFDVCTEEIFMAQLKKSCIISISLPSKYSVPAINLYLLVNSFLIIFSMANGSAYSMINRYRVPDLYPLVHRCKWLLLEQPTLYRWVPKSSAGWTK